VLPCSAQFVKCDVTSWDDITSAFKAAIAFSPDKTVDIVVPNAGLASDRLPQWLHGTPYDPADPSSDTPPPPSQRVIDVNYKAVFNTVHAALWYFRNFPGSADSTYSKNVVFVSSMAGYTPMSGVPSYNSSKWGVRGMFWSLRNMEKLLGEGKPKFRANLIAPTWVRTNMTKGLVEYLKKVDAKTLVAEVEDVTDVVLRMVTDENVKGKDPAMFLKTSSSNECCSSVVDQSKFAQQGIWRSH
jgi:5'-hydroxyaverantin dehydrogenase